MLLLSRVFVISALSFSVARAHFTLDYPPTRGFDDDNENQAICGSFNTVKEPRTVFPLGQGGQIQITSHHSTASVFAEISFNSDPNSFTQFNTSSSGQNYPELIGPNSIPEKPICYNVDISALGSPDAKNGTNATLVLIYDGGDGTLYQCADLILVTGATIPSGSIASNLTCMNVATSPPTSSGSSSASASGSASATNTSPSPSPSTGHAYPAHRVGWAMGLCMVLGSVAIAAL